MSDDVIPPFDYLSNPKKNRLSLAVFENIYAVLVASVKRETAAVFYKILGALASFIVPKVSDENSLSSIFKISLACAGLLIPFKH